MLGGQAGGMLENANHPPRFKWLWADAVTDTADEKILSLGEYLPLVQAEKSFLDASDADPRIAFCTFCPGVLPRVTKGTACGEKLASGFPQAGP